jgi:hypothetical protein
MLIYLLFFFIGLNLTYIVGHLFSSFYTFKNSSYYTRIFYKSSIGLFTIIFITALYYTSFNTIILGFFIPTIYLISNNKSRLKIDFRIPFWGELLRLNAIIGIPIISFQFILHPGISQWSLIPVDINYYSEIIFHLKDGLESKYGALTSLGIENIPIRSPYHYGELWITCFFWKLFPNAMIGYTLLYVTYPLLICLFFSGIIGFISLFTNNLFIVLGFGFLTLFIGPIDLPFFKELFNQGHLLESNTIVFENSGFFFNTLSFSYHGQKHALFYILFLLFLMEYQTNKRNAYIILSFCPLINFGLLPGLVAGISFYEIVRIIVKKVKNITLSKTFILPILLTALFYWLFYSINGGKDIEKQVSIVLMNSKNLNLNGEIAKLFYRIVYCILFVLIIYLWIIFLFVQKNSILSKFKEILLLISGIILCGVLSRTILEGFNSAQILTYLLPALNITLSVLFITSIFLSQSILKKSLLLALFFSISFNNIYWTHFHSTTRREISIDKNYSKSFTKLCLSELSKVKNPKIGYILSQNEASTIEAGFWYGYYPCEFIFTKDYFNIYSLNYPYFNKKEEMYNYATNHMRFFIDKNDSKKNFENQLTTIIKRKNIKFILLKNDAIISEEINKMMEKNIKDPASGNSFIILNIDLNKPKKNNANSKIDKT